jgi:hypothetical protein
MNADDFANGKMLGQAVRQESIVVNRAKGLTVELLLATGQVVFSNGEVWTVSQMEIGNLRKGVGTIEGQNIMVHPDGSTIIGFLGLRDKARAIIDRFASQGRVYDFIAAAEREPYREPRPRERLIEGLKLALSRSAD